MSHSPQQRYRIVLDQVLDPSTCEALIARARAAGFGPGSRDATRGPQMLDADGARVEDAVATLHDPRLALRLYVKLADVLPRKLDGRVLAGLSPTVQVLRYGVGDHTRRHVDPSIHRTHHERTEATVLVYLDDAFEGGNTDFHEGDETVQVTPAVGKAVVFDRRIEHRGTPVLEGNKHVLRFGVFYADDEMSQRFG